MKVGWYVLAACAAALVATGIWFWRPAVEYGTDVGLHVAFQTAPPDDSELKRLLLGG